MENTARQNNVEEYIAQFPKDVQIALNNLRKAIKQSCPKAEEKISYGMPYYGYHGRLAYFAAFKDHCSLFIMGSTAKKFSKELRPYMKTAHTAHFTPKKPIPAALVKKLIKDTMKENEERSKGKKTK